MSEARFTFICGSDDFIVGRLGRERFDALAAGAADEFSREVVNGFAANVAEVEAAVNRFRDAVQTIGLFGGRRCVWLKDVNFLADSVTGRSEGTLAQVEELRRILESVNPAEVGVLLTAAPVDRRRSFLKWAEGASDCTLVGGEAGDEATLQQVALAEAKAQDVVLSEAALAMLLARVGGQTRLLVEEVRKLAAYVGVSGGTVEETDVAEIVPNFSEGDFFEAADAFFSGDLQRTLDALHRHFFAGGDARPVLSSLQNRNRILIQLKMLIDAGEVRLGPGGFDKAGFARAQEAYGKAYGALTEKSSCNVFTQNLWYLGKLASSSKMPSLKRMIDQQQEFYAAFQRLLDRPSEAEEVLREMAVRCLTA
jgi:DNA polymerase-3 subunit delta